MRRRRTHRPARGPRMAEVTTVLFLLALLAFILVFKDDLAANLSGIVGAFNGPAPAVAPAGDDNQALDAPTQGP